MKLHTTKLSKTIIVTAALIVAMNAFALAASGTWTGTASLHTARDGHTATLLPNGNVVIAGGENNNQTVSSSEVYSPTFDSWTASGNLNVARSNASAVILPNGQVLIAGGCVSSCLSGTTRSAELYNSVGGKWSSTGAMLTARTYFSMVRLPSGPDPGGGWMHRPQRQRLQRRHQQSRDLQSIDRQVDCNWFHDRRSGQSDGHAAAQRQGPRRPAGSMAPTIQSAALNSTTRRQANGPPLAT